MTAKLSDFMREMFDEAKEVGRTVKEELRRFQETVQSERNSIKRSCQPQVCLMEKFFADQNKLPPERRTNYVMLSCPCSKCSPEHL